MSQLPQEQIPFVLLHKTGFLKDFAASVLELVAQGMIFIHVKQFVQNRRQHPYCCNYNNYIIKEFPLTDYNRVLL